MPPKLRSFSTRLSLYIVTLTGLFFIASFVLYFSFSSRAIKTEAFQKAEKQLDYVTKSVDALLEGIELSVHSTSFYVTQVLDRPEAFPVILSNMMESNPSIYGASLAFEPDYYEQFGKYYMLYGRRADSDTLVNSRKGKIAFSLLGNDAYDYHIHDWYQIPKLLSTSYWSEPYFDEGAGDVLMTTYTQLLYDADSLFVGVITADIALNWFSTMVLESKPYDDSYAYMLSRNAYYLVHREHFRILNHTFFSATDDMDDPEVNLIGQEMVAGKSGHRSFDNNGVYSHAFYKPISRIGWSIATVSTEESVLEEFHQMTRMIWIVAVVCLLLIFIFVVMISRNLSKPLEQFAESASQIAKGDFDAALPQIKTHDEMAKLHHAFANMQTSLKEYIAQLQSSTAERERIASELEIATSIQMGMLPKVFPPFPHHDAVDLYAKLTPAKEVGGDLYDFFIQDNKLFFAVGDASGKGIPASLLMAVTISLFRSVASRVAQPNEILYSLNSSIAESNEANMFITLFVGVLDLATGVLNYSNAGHNPPVLISPNGEVEYMKVEANLALGIFHGVNFKAQQIEIAPNSAIFAYSDGLTEAENVNKALYSEERLLHLLSEVHGMQTPREQVDAIEASVNAFVDGNEQSDDLTLLMLSYKSEK